MRKYILLILILLLFPINNAAGWSYSSGHTGISIGVGPNGRVYGGISIGRSYSNTRVRHSGYGIYRGGWVGPNIHRHYHYGAGWHPVHIIPGVRPFRPVWGPVTHITPQGAFTRYGEYATVVRSNPVIVQHRPIVMTEPAVVYNGDGSVKSITYDVPVRATRSISSDEAQRRKEIRDMDERLHQAKMAKKEIQFEFLKAEMEYELERFRRKNDSRN